jgi:dihydropyrimidinase
VTSLKLDTAVVGGLVVSSGGIERLDVGIKDGKIVERVASLDASSAARVVDAAGCYVLPGAIDAHLHPQYGDNLAAGSIAAAFGGITTVVPFVYAYEGLELGQAIDEFLEGDGAHSMIDYGLHLGVVNPADTVDQIPDAATRGVNSFKFFLAYRRRGMMVDDDAFLRAMDLIAGIGGIAMVHAENGLAIDFLEKKFIAEGKVSVEWFERSRPKPVEFEAVFRAIQLAKLVDCPLYLVHQTTGEAVGIVREAMATGQFVVAETCPQYLLWTNEDLVKRGPIAVLAPPYRTRWDQETLWKGVAEGVIATIGSDHAPHEKEDLANVFNVPVGTPQVETMLPLMYDRGVNAGRLTLPRLVAALCENPARAFGLYPKKGSLALGSDADIVVLDPAARVEVHADRMHSSKPFDNIYDGWSSTGTAIRTMQRGRDVLVNGELVARSGDGQFLASGPPQKTI